MSRIRLKVSDLEWMHRQLASLAKDTEGTNEGRRWEHWRSWVWAEFQRRSEEKPETNGNGVKP
jgi:hypothetical protein